MNPQLERAYRNRMSLPPDQRAAVEEAYAAALMEHEVRMGNRPAPESSPADLDPVEAAAAPIAPDPAVQPRSVERPATENAPPGIGLPDGYAEWAEGMAIASGDKPRAERLKDADEFDARVDRQAAAYNRATGMPQPSGLADNDGYRDWSGWQPGDPLPGRPAMGPTALESARADQTASRLDAIEAKYGSEARAIAERGDAEGVTDYDAVKTPRERQKNAYRRQQEKDARMQGSERDANGGFLSSARADIRAQDERQAASNKAFRAQVAAAPRSAVDPRMERWKAQAMLAGSNPRKNAVNAWYAMGDEGLNDWQRLTMAKALRPDIEGTTPLDVQANSAANAMRFMNSDIIAGGMPGVAEARMRAEQNAMREKALAFATAERNKIHWNNDAPMDRNTADRLRRRVEAIFPGMGGVVDALPIED